MTPQTNTPNHEEKKNEANTQIPPKKTAPPVENPKTDTETTEAA
jgi:hypothetical protein